MPTPLNDLTGKIFERLTVIKRARVPEHIVAKNRVFWECVCECGTKKIVAGYNLVSGNTRSCGCIFRTLQRSMYAKNGTKKLDDDKPHWQWERK